MSPIYDSNRQPGPKKTKFEKYQKGNLKNKIASNPLLLEKMSFGRISLIASESGRLAWKQFLQLAFSLNKSFKRTGEIKFKIFPHWPITSKPLEVRMGKGKGEIKTYIAKILTGSKLIEIETKNIGAARFALERLQYKLSIKTKILYE